jgi:hypothetical protein
MRRGVGAIAFLEDIWPVFGDDAQEIERHLPPAGKVAGHQIGEPGPVRAFRLDLVHQPGQVSRQPDGVGGGGRHDDLLVEKCRDMCRQAAFPGTHQRRQQQQPLNCGDRRHEVDGGRRVGLECGFVLVELAERADDRQDRRATAEHVDENAAQRARGTARRHIDGGIGQRQRVAVETETGNETS